MENSQLRIKLKNVRAIKEADIALDGITVISGENGCGKSTISKLLYNLCKTSITFDDIVDKFYGGIYEDIYHSLYRVVGDLSMLELDEVSLGVSKFRQRLSYINRHNIDIEEICDNLDSLIKIFLKIPENNTSNRYLGRVKYILRRIVDKPRGVYESEDSIIDMLQQLKSKVQDRAEMIENFKGNRSLSILKKTLSDAFYDSALPEEKDSYNLLEYGIPIIDWNGRKMREIDSVQKIVYTDTPMVVGFEFAKEREHWNDLTNILKSEYNKESNDNIDTILKEEILRGETKVENAEFAKDHFVYNREDGKVFDLLECATGLKSFSMMQILNNNGYLSKDTVMIIDEPEAHLHPQWVVEYARLIVLLNKEMGVRFLLASHSPDFVSAIKYISEKEGVDDKLNFYLAEKCKEEKEQFLYEYKSLGTSIDKIFESFNIAYERMDQYGLTE